jgi:hypothetical protein
MSKSGSIALALVVGAALLGCGADDAGRPLVPARLEFASQPAAITTSQLPIGVIVVELMTEDGRLVTSEPASVTISLASSDTGAHLLGTTTVQAVQGMATFTDLTVARAGSDFRLVARTAGLDSAVSSPFQIVAAPAASLRFDPIAPSPVTAGSNVQLVVRSVDAAGNPMSASGTVTLGYSRVAPFGATIAPDGIFGGTTAELVNGVATFPGISFQKTGGYDLSASTPELSSATSAHLTVTSGPMTQLAFITPPTNGTANVALPAISVQQLDQYGNGMSIPPGPPYTVTLSLGVNPSGAVLNGTTTRTVFGSVPAKFDDITIDRPGSGYTLVATSGTMTVTSGPFTVP